MGTPSFFLSQTASTDPEVDNQKYFFRHRVFYDRIWNIREVNAPADGSTSFQHYGLNKDEIAMAIPVRLLF